MSRVIMPLFAALLPLALADKAMAEGDPLEFAAVYTGDVLANVAGGRERGSAYLDNFDLTLKADTEELFGWTGTEVFVYGLYNNGTKFSDSLVGDLQMVNNIETGVTAVRLFEAWMRVRLWRGSELLVGLYDLNSEFDVLGASTVFIGSAHGIGTDISQAGVNGPSIFPVTGLSLRLAVALNDRWTVRGAILDGVPGDPKDPDATSIRLSSDEGALLIGEAERSSDASRMLVGAWAYSTEFSADPLDLDDNTATGRRGNWGAYVRGERTLFDGESTLSVFGRLGYADGDFNIFAYFFSAGLNWRGGIGGRTADTLGLAVAWAETSANVEGLAADYGQDVDAREIAVELTYRMPMNKSFSLQPHLQFIINPGLNPALDNAWVIGLRFQAALFH